jgi:hypothetical protein
MSDDATQSPSSQDGSRLIDRRADLVWWATRVGLVLALVGLVDGLMMALKRQVATCPNGTYFREGTTNFDCYVHPQAGIGIAIAVFSVVLGILVVFSGIVARASLGSRPLPP